MATQSKHSKKLTGGPFKGETVLLTGDATSTITFGVKDLYGRYAGHAKESLDWQPITMKEDQTMEQTEQDHQHHKYSVKRLKKETEQLQQSGANIVMADHVDGGKVMFRSESWGKPWVSPPMTVEEAKFFLFGFRARG